jgi:hypothetical protein
MTDTQPARLAAADTMRLAIDQLGEHLDDAVPYYCAHTTPARELEPAEECCEYALPGTPYCERHLCDDDPDRWDVA